MKAFRQMSYVPYLIKPCHVWLEFLKGVWNGNATVNHSGIRKEGREMVVVVMAFSLLARIRGECLTIHSPPALFFSSFQVKISLRTLIPLFRPGSVHSGSGSWDDCDRVFPDELHVSSFPDRSHTMPGQRHNQPTLTSLGQRCMRV